jgi:hypothetical protein
MTDRNIFDDEDLNKRREERQRRLSERNQGDLRRVLSTVEGRRFVWRVISEGGPFRSSFNPNGLIMANRTGQQDIALFVLKNVFEAQPEAFAKMQSESASDKLLQEAEISKEEESTNG